MAPRSRASVAWTAPFASRVLALLLGAALRTALGAALGVAAGPASAQETIDLFGSDFGTAAVLAEDGSVASGAAPGEGAVLGLVFDADSGNPIGGATVILSWPAPADGSPPRQEVAVTGGGGDFEFPSIPAGEFDLSFVKSGYRTSAMTGFEVREGLVNRADFPLPAVAASASDDVLDLEAFVVDASVVNDMVAQLELRLESDQLLNIMSAEDFSKFAASDVADALKRVAGVNVVEGQFAIIRGLEDRYSSTLYNHAPVPSPDPDSQSVQLDLFPSNVVGSLFVLKTFAAETPSNSAGGTIDILTHEYPDETQASLSIGSGFNGNANGRFLERRPTNAVGRELEPVDLVETDLGASVAGRTEYRGRELRFKGVFNREVDYQTRSGFQESREPDRGRSGRRRIVENGDLALRQLSLSRGLFDLTESEESLQTVGFFAGGLDLDRDGTHRVDSSVFFTRKEQQVVQAREDGYLPNFNYGPFLEDLRANGYDTIDLPNEEPLVDFVTPGGPLFDIRDEEEIIGLTDGQAFYAPVSESRSFSAERELLVAQLNGEHEDVLLEGFSVDWATNFARTSQAQSAFGVRYFFEPEDVNAQIPRTVPVSIAELGPGKFLANSAVTFNEVDIDEIQGFGRLDLGYEDRLTDFLEIDASATGWFERAERDVASRFLLNAASSRGSVTFTFEGDTPAEAAAPLFDDLQLARDDGRSVIANSTNESSRQIAALGLGLTGTFWEDIDLQGGVRVENLVIESINDAFTGSVINGSSAIFPSKYLFCDRLDNPAIPREQLGAQNLEDVVFNDQIVGIENPADENGIVDRITDEEIRACTNGEIDELLVLPTAGITVRPTFVLGDVPGLEQLASVPGFGFLDDADLTGLTFRFAYSQTTARPSFREMGYYVTADPGTDDRVVGNPQLDLSDVESFDFRVEYVWGELGDLVAVSLFQKSIQDPIEAIVLQDPVNALGGGQGNFRTFFNNPNEAELRGIEAETRLHLGLGGALGDASEFLDYFSIGGNYTYIDGTVDRSEVERGRAGEFFICCVDDAPVRLDSELASSRPLFSQPSWIANADVTFDQPDWGTQVTLAYFAISEVLDAVGSVALNPGNEVLSYTLDRYTDAFHQVDLVASQEFSIPRTPGRFTLRASFKNITDSKRRVIYDQQQTGGNIPERVFQIGTDYSFSVKYSYEF